LFPLTDVAPAHIGEVTTGVADVLITVTEAVVEYDILQAVVN